jgi:hypothetical protein
MLSQRWAQGTYHAVEKLDARMRRGWWGWMPSSIHTQNQPQSHGATGVRRFSPLLTALLLIRRSFL